MQRGKSDGSPRLRRDCGRPVAPPFVTAASLPTRLPTNCPAASLALLADSSPKTQFLRWVLGRMGSGWQCLDDSGIALSFWEGLQA